MLHRFRRKPLTLTVLKSTANGTNKKECNNKITGSPPKALTKPSDAARKICQSLGGLRNVRVCHEGQLQTRLKTRKPKVSMCLGRCSGSRIQCSVPCLGLYNLQWFHCGFLLPLLAMGGLLFGRPGTTGLSPSPLPWRQYQSPTKKAASKNQKKCHQIWPHWPPSLKEKRKKLQISNVSHRTTVFPPKHLSGRFGRHLQGL